MSTTNTTTLNLDEASAELSRLNTRNTSPVSIICAGAEGRIPIHWFNQDQVKTLITDFTVEIPGTEANGPVQLTVNSLRQLCVGNSTTVFEFEFTDADFELLEKLNMRAVDDDDNLLVYRHPATEDGTVKISRDQLFVYLSDIEAYAIKVKAHNQRSAEEWAKRKRTGV